MEIPHRDRSRLSGHLSATALAVATLALAATAAAGVAADLDPDRQSPAGVTQLMTAALLLLAISVGLWIAAKNTAPPRPARPVEVLALEARQRAITGGIPTFTPADTATLEQLALEAGAVTSALKPAPFPRRPAST